MIESVDALSIFKTNLCRFFLGNCPDGKCFLVKKHQCRLHETGDFSIPLNTAAWRKHFKKVSSNAKASTSKDGNGPGEASNLDSQQVEASRDPQAPEKFVPELMEQSKEWILKIDKCKVQMERLCIFLKKIHTYKTIVNLILTQGESFGKGHHNAGEVMLSTDLALEDQWMMNLTDYRVYLMTNVVQRLLEANGYSVSVVPSGSLNQRDAIHLHISSASKGKLPEYATLPCGRIVNKRRNGKDDSTTAEEYVRHRCDEMRVMMRHKYGEQVDTDPVWVEYLRHLGEGAVTIDLLNARPTCHVTLDMELDGTQRRDGYASFILYNCARVAAIRRQFQKLSFERYYPDIIPVEEADFSLLGTDEEWELVSGYLLLYPSVVQATVEHLREGRPAPHHLCHFMHALAMSYSRYYQHIRILTEPRPSLLPRLFARLYLLQVVEQVLHNGLSLLGIEPVPHM